MSGLGEDISRAECPAVHHFYCILPDLCGGTLDLTDVSDNRSETQFGIGLALFQNRSRNLIDNLTKCAPNQGWTIPHPVLLRIRLF
jgi:hypothetical protein